MSRAKLPRRLSQRDIERVEREVERTKARLRDAFAPHWDAIARALGRDPSFLNRQANARDTVKDALLHRVATYITTAL
jgi:hypothetical protein